MAVKRLHKEETETETERVADRLSHMPESLQLHILSSLNARDAVQTMVLSKSWVSSWTCIPILNFSSDGFKQLRVFDDFVADVLSHRQPVKLDRLTFKRRGDCSVEILEKVFGYAFLHGVEELEANALPLMASAFCENWTWPWSSDSLKTLKLQSPYHVDCSFLEPRSSVGAFKNLTSLHLHRVVIRDLDPFSGFPVLDKLRLMSCFLITNGNALNVHALQLSEFTFFYYNQTVDHCEFTTPKLRYFEWRGNSIPRLKAHLPVLDTAVINYTGCWRKEKEKMAFDNLLMLFNTLYRARSLAVSAPVVHLLTLFPVNGCCSPFRALKCLKLDFSLHHLFTESRLFLIETLKLVSDVKAYLLHKSHDAKCIIINDEESPCSITQKSMCDTTQRQAAQQAGPFTLGRPKRTVKKPTRFLD